MAKKQKILIVEDDFFIMRATQFALKKEGYDLDYAENGKVALDKIKKIKYDLILLDLVMPVKDGFEVLAELKQANNKVPVLVYSNLFDQTSKKRVLELGGKDYFEKAKMSLDELIVKIKLLLRH